jgi:hypothetical protein
MSFFDCYAIYTIIATTLCLCGCLVIAGVWLCSEFKRREKVEK